MKNIDRKVYDKEINRKDYQEVSQHTPTPWKWVNGIGIVQDEGDKMDGYLMNAKHPANATFIVRACNAHQELVELLRTVEKFLRADTDNEENIYTLKIMVRNAIAKAEGK